MQHNEPYPSLEDMQDRCAWVGWTLAELAKNAGLAKSTVYKVAAGQDPRASTAKKMLSALEARERDQMGHLLALPHVQEFLAEQRAAA